MTQSPYQLHAADGFEPIATRVFASPDAPELAPLHARDPEDTAGLAQQQFADL